MSASQRQEETTNTYIALPLLQRSNGFHPGSVLAAFVKDLHGTGFWFARTECGEGISRGTSEGRSGATDSWWRRESPAI